MSEDVATTTEAESAEAKPKFGQRFSRWLGFGLRQTLFCFMTDFIDPIAGEKFQEQFDPGSKLHKWMEGGTAGSRRESLLNGRFSFLKRNGTAEEVRLEELKEKATSDDLNKYLHQTKDLPGHEAVGKEMFGDEFGQKPKTFLQKSKGLFNGETSLRQQVWLGEIFGDFSAVFVYLGLKSALEKPIDKIIGGLAKKNDAQYEHRAHKDMKAWARENGIEKDDPRYQKRLAEFKHYQAESYVDSAIIAVSAAATNVGFQRFFGNTRPLAVIAGGKAIGSFLTFMSMWSFNRALPRTAQTLDEEADRRLFSKIVRKVQRIFGLEESRELHHEREELDKKVTETQSLRFDLTPEERSRLNTKPKADFRERSVLAQTQDVPAQMSM